MTSDSNASQRRHLESEVIRTQRAFQIASDLVMTASMDVDLDLDAEGGLVYPDRLDEVLGLAVSRLHCQSAFLAAKADLFALGN